MNKTYTIKEVAEHFSLPISTIRYYDKKGLLPFVSKNSSGYREFTESDLSMIYTICCLKNTGMQVREIKKYIELCMVGPQTINARLDILSRHKTQVLARQIQLEESLKEVNNKIERYSSPQANRIIEQQIKLTKRQKLSANLEDKFKHL